jgi:adenosylcobinamide kinase / adenosylcobinamide-phosphate guanylyltransferase
MGLAMLIGPARSGKSRLAVRMAQAWRLPVTFVATAEARDQEMAERIARHRADRPADWETVEEPVDLRSAVDGVSPDRGVIIDCLTLWLSNVMERNFDDSSIAARAGAAAEAAASREAPAVVVTNEVGGGIVPIDPSVRRYRDLLGLINQIWAETSDRAFLVMAGRVLDLKPAGGIVGGHD